MVIRLKRTVRRAGEEIGLAFGLALVEGELEILTTSKEHERIKKWLADLLADYFFETGIDIEPRGQATMRVALREAGAEPDESWCIGPEKEFPDLVPEVALTSGGVDKLEIYRQFRVPKVWFWRAGKPEIFALVDSGNDEPQPSSRLRPNLDIALVERCVALSSWQQARCTFRTHLSVDDWKLSSFEANVRCADNWGGPLV